MNIEMGKAAGLPQKPLGKLTPNPRTRLREQFHEVARFKYLAKRTEVTYWHWVVRYLKFHRREGKWVHPREYLSHLASEKDVASATQNQALRLVEG